MKAKLLLHLNRLEALSLRERLMLLLGLPLVLLVIAELLVFEPAQKRAVEARKQAERQKGELKQLQVVLDSLPVVSALPAADQLLTQRNELQARIDAAEAAKAGLSETTDWGSVVRATVAGTPGLTLTQLKTVPPEVVFASAAVKPAAATSARPGTPASAAAPVAAAAASASLPELTVYRHRADLSVKGNFDSLLGYLQTLQRAPGDLRWDRLQLSVAAYPQAMMQLSLYTLSSRAETPFN